MAKVSLNQCLGQLTVPFLGRRLCFSHPWQFLLLLALFISCFSHQSVCLLCVLPSNLQFVLRCTCPFFLDVLPSCEMVSHCKEPVTFTRLHWRIFSFSSLLKNRFVCGKCVSLGNLAILQTFDFFIFHAMGVIHPSWYSNSKWKVISIFILSCATTVFVT